MISQSRAKKIKKIENRTDLGDVFSPEKCPYSIDRATKDLENVPSCRYTLSLSPSSLELASASRVSRTIVPPLDENQSSRSPSPRASSGSIIEPIGELANGVLSPAAGNSLITPFWQWIDGGREETVRNRVT